MPSPAELEGKTIGYGAKLSNALPGCVAATVFANVSTPGYRNNRIRSCINAPLKKLSVFRRQAADGFFKFCGEFALIFIADSLGDLGNAQPRFAQKL